MKAEKWVPATRLDEVPNHNQISMKRINGENHVGKNLLQKEIERKSTNDMFQETLSKP